jgi:hypothetical protein
LNGYRALWGGLFESRMDMDWGGGPRFVASPRTVSQISAGRRYVVADFAEIAQIKFKISQGGATVRLCGGRRFTQLKTEPGVVVRI